MEVRGGRLMFGGEGRREWSVYGVRPQCQCVRGC